VYPASSVLLPQILQHHAITSQYYCCLLQIALVLVDEVHLLNEAGRGSALEAGCICRLKAIAALPEMAQVGALTSSTLFPASFTAINNSTELACWLIT
jgi:superfamily II helicase